MTARTHISVATRLIAAALAFPAALADPPRLVRSEPAGGAKDVAVDAGVIRLVFDRDMRTDSFTCWKSTSGQFPPTAKDQAATWPDARTFELKLDRLKPDTEYAIQLNSDDREGFRSAEGEPLAITTIRFKTAAAKKEARQDIFDPNADAPKKREESRRDVFDPTADGGDGKPPADADLVDLSWKARPGIVSEMSQTSRMRFNITVSAGGEQQTQNIDQLFKLKYREEVLEADSGRPTRVRRKISLAQASAKDPNTGEIQRQDMPLVGVEAELTIQPDGSMQVARMISGERETADAMAADSHWISLAPPKPVRVGDSWKPSGERLAQMLAALTATDGSIELKLARVEHDPKLDAKLAIVEGKLRLKLKLPNGLSADLEGTLEEDFVPSLGLPFLRKVNGDLKIDQTITENGQQAALRGTGTVEMVEERAVARTSAGGEPKSDTVKPAKKECEGETGKSGGIGGGTAAIDASRGRSSGVGGANSGIEPGSGPANSVQLSLFRDTAQGAFVMLIPKGWRTEGGMLPSGVSWNVVDLVENNIRFRATSPDGKSFFGMYPRFYFVDPANYRNASMGILQTEMGGTVNGCWLYPYMSLLDYIQNIVFGQFAKHEFINPRILGRPVEVAELKALVPSVAGHWQGGYVDFECDIGGVPSRGRMYAVLAAYGAGMWTSIGTWGLVSPKSRWPQDERLMELCLRTFRFDPQWVQKATAAAAQRGKQFYETTRELGEAYNQMAQQRAQRNSNIQEEFYKVLTGQIETRDPQTGEEKWLPSYNRAFTNGHGDYVLSDYTGSLPIEQNTDWRELQIVNRNK